MRATTPSWSFVWGVGGVLALLSISVWRLTGPVGGALEHAIGPAHLVFGAGWVAFMVYAEGWRGFHKQFSPRVVQRALELPSERAGLAWAAPVVCVGLVHATRKRLIVSWSLVIGISLLVVAIRQVPQPWRGIIDLGVVLGLGTGTLSVAWFAIRALAGRPPAVAADWPTA